MLYKLWIENIETLHMKEKLASELLAAITFAFFLHNGEWKSFDKEEETGEFIEADDLHAVPKITNTDKTNRDVHSVTQKKLWLRTVSSRVRYLIK